MQDVIVGLIVACALFAVLKRYLPRSFRSGLRMRAADLAKRAGWQALSDKLESVKQASSSCGDGCGGGCDGCGTPAPEPGRKQIFMRKL